jgi:hypothetical protein
MAAARPSEVRDWVTLWGISYRTLSGKCSSSHPLLSYIPADDRTSVVGSTHQCNPCSSSRSRVCIRCCMPSGGLVVAVSALLSVSYSQQRRGARRQAPLQLGSSTSSFFSSITQAWLPPTVGGRRSKQVSLLRALIALSVRHEKVGACNDLQFAVGMTL